MFTTRKDLIFKPTYYNNMKENKDYTIYLLLAIFLVAVLVSL